MKDKILKLLNTMIMFGLFAYIGARCTMVGLHYSDKFPIVFLAISILGIYIHLMVHIILHEAGHMVAGLLTGYKYVSFRIGSFVWIRNKEQKIELKKMKLQGTAGQCLMCPPELPAEECPYKLYHLMGGLTNICFGCVGIILALVLPNNFLTFILCEEFGVVGIVLGITNLIPCKSGGVQNDGYNLLDLNHNLAAKKCMNLVLALNALITVADSYEDLPESLVNEIKEIDFTQTDISNSSIANAFLMQIGLLFAEGNYEQAYKLQKYVSESMDILPLFRNEAKCECLFYELLNGAEREVIEKRYDKPLQKYIKATASFPSRQRLMYTYNKLYEKDDKKAAECMRKLEKMVDTYVIKADAKYELEVARKIATEL